jgi:hypothetical protein
LSIDEPTPEARAAAARAINERMGQLKLSVEDVQERSGLSVNTAHRITEQLGSHNKSTWVALAAALDWPRDYLLNILDGRADKNVPVQSPLEAHLAKLAESLSALQQKVDGIDDVVHVTDKKVDLMLGPRLPPAETAPPD